MNKTYESYFKIENLIASSLRGGLDLIARFDLCNGRARMVILFRPPCSLYVKLHSTNSAPKSREM